jgi:hypothetical protein
MTNVLPSFWDDVPPPHRSLLQWVRRGLHRRALPLFPSEALALNIAYQERVMARVLAIALPQRRAFLAWVEEAHYRGRNYASGSWTFDEPRTEAVLRAAISEALHDLDAADFPDLDAWLAALHADQLAAPAPTEAAPAGPPYPRPGESARDYLWRRTFELIRAGRRGEFPRDELLERRREIACPRCRQPMGDAIQDSRRVQCFDCRPATPRHHAPRP